LADIQKDEIKLMSSQVLADTEDGGGQMTSNEIVDGNVNNLFPDISRLDRTYGRVSLRKAYLSIQTADRATYYGAHIALTEQAADPLVATTMFTTEDWFDHRANCRDRIEAYLVKGPQFNGYLYGMHYAGTRSLSFLTDMGVTPPEIGDVLVMRDDTNEQYVRVMNLETSEIGFVDVKGAYTKQQILVTIGRGLDYDFSGEAAIRSTRELTGLDSKIFTTVVADASKYYGVSKLAAEALSGELQIQADTIFASVVPSSQSSTPITDFGVGVARAAVSPKATGEIEESRTYGISSNAQMYVGEALMPGSFSIDGVLSDDGTGNIVDIGSTIIGSIDYTTGVITFAADIDSSSGSATWSYVPAHASTKITNSGFLAIRQANRAFSYVFACPTLPLPGTFQVVYLSGGKWYTIVDDGSGRITSPSTLDLGSGTVNYDTGSISLSLKYLPDVDSKIYLSWCDDEDLFEIGKYGTTYQELEPEYKYTLTTADEPIPGTFSITYDDDGGNAITDDGLGLLFQDGVEVGKVIYTTGEISFTPVPVPDGDAVFTVAWEDETADGGSDPDWPKVQGNGPVPAPSGDVYTVADLSHLLPAGEEIIPGSFYVRCPGMPLLQDDGAGNLFQAPGTGASYLGGGSINYATGGWSAEYYDISTQKEIVAYDYSDNPYGQPGGGGWYPPVYDTSEVKTKPVAGTDVFSYSFKHSLTPGTTPAGDPMSETFSSVKKYYMSKASDVDVKSDSLMLTYNSQYCTLNSEGQIIASTDPLSGTQEIIGSFNKTTGVFSIDDDFTADTAPMVVGSGAGLVHIGRIGQMTARTPGAPITPGSLTVSAEDMEGNLMTATADFSGGISGDYIEGEVDYQYGVIYLRFGTWEPNDATNQGQWWYNAGLLNEEETEVWKPIMVEPESVVMNCVIQSYLPLDPDLLGLNPVRLSIDGKVPIFKDGDVVLIHHTQTEPVSASAGTTVALYRSNVNLIELYDNNGVYIPEVGNYSVDLAAGEITFEDPLDLAAYTSPFQALHRIEDMVLASDVQVTGHMALSQPLQHTYPATETLVSSVLPIGDVQARIYNVFTDSSWSSVWSNEREHSPTTSQYDTVNYPIITTNESSVKERFACVFTSSNTVDVVGEHLGVMIADAPITSDIAPVNPATGLPYFTIRHEGWGSGWSAGNVLRFNSDAGNYPIWFCRTTKQGPATENSDHYTIQIRGDSS
jgi:hypothetical protein